MKPIFIIGYMGSGKTTFGRALARRLGKEFIDLDFYIHQRFRKSISEIFAAVGEARFREIESAMLREVGEFEDVVVSCGGGTPCFGDNIGYMKSRGLTVRLNAGLKCLVDRLMRGGGKRPIVAGKSREELCEFVERHLAEREPFYSLAEVTFNGENLENSRQIGESVEMFLDEMRKKGNFAP